MFGKKDKSSSLSLPRSYTLHGVEIKKLPTGQYIKALQTLENLPRIILEELFPNMQFEEILSKVKEIDEDLIWQLITKLMRIAPEQFFRLVSELIDADYDHLVNKLTPKENLEVIMAFWKANEMSDFLEQLKTMLGGMKQNPMKALKLGFKK